MSASVGNQPLVSIVVPAYNEEAISSETVARQLAVSQADEIVIVQGADHCGRARGFGLWFALSGARGITRAAFLPLHGQQGPDVSFEPVHECQHDRSRNLL